MPPSTRLALDPDGVHEQHEISTARRRFFSRTLSFRSRSRRSSPQRTDSTPDQISKGTYGLKRQYVPASFDPRRREHDTDAHVVFVHGLAGDSEHTWSKGGILWPRDLLPAQDAFTNVAVYTFGYDSNFRKSNMLGINDFAKSLLCNIQDDPIILSSKSPIIFIGHSMGGLVIQMGYIIARRSPEFEELADRIKAMFFLSTPHHGSNHAEILSALFRLAPGPRPYLDELKSGSNIIKSILADFTRHVDELHLQSFYETKPLQVSGIGRLQVVDKHNAVLGYEKRSQLLNGDHRSICKFDSAEDSNFKIIHQALARTISIIRGQDDESHEFRTPRHRQKISQYLGITEPPEDDLFRVAAERVPETCAWIETNAAYNVWSNQSQRKMLWVRGPPASGKSFVSGSIVERLKKEGANVCYYFIVFGNASKATISNLLLSIAWQAAAYDPGIERKVIEAYEKDPRLTQTGDYRTIWRKLWLEAILCARPNTKKPMFIVVDALDECRLENDLVRLLVKLTEMGFAKVMVTSRNEPDYYHITWEAVILLSIDMADTQRDISIYLDQRRNIIDEEIREIILQRSNGCFLWAFLVVERLSNCADSSTRLRLVKEEPIGMEDVYSRVLESISNREDVEHILTWVACATRPLSLQEIAFVMKLQPSDIGEIVRRNCYDLIFFDSRDQINIRHSSAREFLLRNYLKDVKGAHGKLALACLDYLMGAEMKNKQRRRMSVTIPARSPFVSYACSSLCEHINLASSQNKSILVSMASFFSSSHVLAWIEYLSQQKRLEVILATAQALRDFIRRKSKTDLLLGDEIMIVDEWADDLVKLVSKFGRQLLIHPESIFALIAPFCPPESAPRKLHKAIAPGPNVISVCGISSTTWDDCLCTISIPSSQISAPASSASMNSQPSSQRPERMNSFAISNGTFCIGTSHGRAIVYNDKTFLPSNIVTLNTRLPVQILMFATSQPLLAIANNKSIQIWNTTKWEQEWETPISKQCMAMTFLDEDQLLLAACKNNTLIVMNLISRKLEKAVKWMDKFVEQCGNRVRGKTPMVASFHSEMDLLAIAYRSMDIIVWNFEEDTYSIYNHDSGFSNVLTEPFTAVWDMTFSRLPGTCLLVASYNIGSLVLFDLMQGSIKVTISDPAAFGRLTSSPDGRTIAAAANDGTIVLFDFETLRKLYRIKTEEPGITVLSFTGDNTRLLDIRGRGQNCRVWDPVALYRREPVDEGSDRTSSIYSGESEFSVLDRNETLPTVTAVACDANGDFFFVGKDDSTVSAYSAKSGFEVAALFSHRASIMRLQYDTSNGRLTSVDTAGCLMIHVIGREGEKWRADRLFTYQTTRTGVQHFVCNAGTDHVLICANDTASVHTVEYPSATLGTTTCDSQIHYHWAQHPSDPESLLLISQGVAYIYSWSKLERLTTNDGIPLRGSLLPEIVVCDAFSFFNGSIFGISCSRAASRSKPRLLCYESPHISGVSTSATQVIKCQSLCENIDHVIGMVHGRLVFLHSNGWVCSVRREGFMESRDVLFHFMPPADWLGASAEFVIAVSQVGDVLFAWKGEVAVVKRGLERSFEL